MVNSNSTGSCTNDNLTIKNLVLDGEIKTTFFTIKYTANDKNNSILRHFIYINGIKSEISRDVGYESASNEFTYTLKNLNNNTLYSVQIEVSNGLSKKISNILNVTTRKSFIYGVRVDETNPNPETCVTYIEDAIGIQPANNTSLGGWKDVYPFNQIYIVGLKNGKETGAINPDNKKFYFGGMAVESNVDVMVKIPKIYWKFTRTSNGYEVRISSDKVDKEYEALAHSVGGVEKSSIYIGAYLSESKHALSKSGRPISGRVSIREARNAVKVKGPGYSICNWFSFVLIQILYIITYKNLNSQKILGMGKLNSASVTGGTDKKGLIYGSQNDSEQMCFLGIEDLWGNMYQWLDGIKTDNLLNILINFENKDFEDESKYKIVSKATNFNGCCNKVIAKNNEGFFPISGLGSYTTYYCDLCEIKGDKFCRVGGSYESGNFAGIFYCSFIAVLSSSNTYTSYRLVYLGD